MAYNIIVTNNTGCKMEFNEMATVIGEDGLSYPTSTKTCWTDAEVLYNAGCFWKTKMVKVLNRKEIGKK